MARELKVRWVGDASNFESTAGRVDNKLTGFQAGLSGLASRSSTAWGAFGKAAQSGGLPLGPLGAALDHVVGGLEHLAGSGAKAGSVLMAGGALAAGLGGIGLKAAEPLERAREQLKAVVENAGGDFSAVEKSLGPVDARMEHFGHTNADTTEALLKLVPAVKSPNEAIKEMSVVSEIASFKHISLADAAGLVAKIHGGATRVLKEFGINLKDVTSADSANENAAKSLTSAQAALAKVHETLSTKTKTTAADRLRLKDAEDKVHEAEGKVATTAKAAADAHAAAGLKGKGYADVLGLVHDKIKGVDEAQADTFGGKLEAAKARITDITAALGERFGKTLVTVGPLAAGLGGILQSGMIPALVGTATSAIAAAAPFLAIAAVVALVGVAIYELVTHWSAVWGAITGIASGAFDWLKSHILMIGSFLLGGPIGLGLYELVKHWGAVWDGIKSIATGAWHILDGIFHSVGGAISGVVSTLAALPGDILRAVGHFADLLFDAGKALISGLIRGVEHAASGLVDAIKKHVVDPVKNIPVIGWLLKSPSKLFAGYGANLMYGLRDGIDAGAPSAHLAMADAVAAMLPGGTKGVPVQLGPFAPAPLSPAAAGFSSSAGAGGGGSVIHVVNLGGIVIQGHVLNDGLVDDIHNDLQRKFGRDGNLFLTTQRPGS